MKKNSRLFRYSIPMVLSGAMAISVCSLAEAQNVSVKTDPVTQVKQSNLPPESPATPNPAQMPDSSAAPAENGQQGLAISNEDQATKSAKNPYGLSDLWKGGDTVSRITLLIMAVMSIGSWYIMIFKFIEQNRIFKAAKEVVQQNFWQQKNLQEGTKRLGERSLFRFTAEKGIEAVQHHAGALQETIDLYSWTSMEIHRAVDHIQNRLQRGLAFLGTVGSTAPFVGLFGTVWGIHHALAAISIAGQATLDKVAGPVGEALIMTAIGLATAVPAVLGYNFLIRRNKNVMEQLRNFAADVQTVLMGGVKQGNETTSQNNGNIKGNSAS